MCLGVLVFSGGEGSPGPPGWPRRPSARGRRPESPIYYRLNRQEIAEALLVLLAEGCIVNPDKAALERALALYGRHNVDFVDAFLEAKALAASRPEVYSFDRDFDRLPGVRRIEPE